MWLFGKKAKCLWCGKSFSPAKAHFYPTLCDDCGILKHHYEEGGGLDPRDGNMTPTATAKVQKLVSLGQLDEKKHRESRRRVIEHARETGQPSLYKEE